MKIKIGNNNFKSLKALNKTLTDAQVKFTFWKGRRFQIGDESFSLNEIIHQVKVTYQTKTEVKHKENFVEFISLIKNLDQRGYESLSQKNFFVRIFTRIKHEFGTLFRYAYLEKLTKISEQLIEKESEFIQETEAREEDFFPVEEVEQEKSPVLSIIEPEPEEIEKEKPSVLSITESKPEEIQQKIIALGSSDYCPDVNILQLFLADFVGGGEGSQMEKAVEFYRHYLTKYCEIFKEDEKAHNILKALQCFYAPSYKMSLEDVIQEIKTRLKRDRYLALAGGYLNSEGGHGIFYEFFLNEKDEVSVRVTNSGEGLSYHPVYHSNQGNDKRNYYYRTLVFSGATLDRVLEVQYLEAILSFNRPRPSTDVLKQIFTFPAETAFTIKGLYAVLFHGWPGSKQILAENPGGGQRGKSCSVLSLIKWIKGEYNKDQASLNQYHLMNFWVKASAFDDHIRNDKDFSSAFLQDSVRKISTHAAKMDQEEILEPDLLSSWKEVTKRCACLLPGVKKKEELARLQFAIAFPNEGINLSGVTPVGRQEKENFRQVERLSSLNYGHRFPGEEPDYRMAAKLTYSYVAKLDDEMSYRLNFFRLLPNCTEFDFEKHVAPHLEPPVDEEVVKQRRAQLIQDLKRIRKAKKSNKDIIVEWPQVEPPFVELVEGLKRGDGLSIVIEDLELAHEWSHVQDRREKFFTDLGMMCQKFHYTEKEVPSLHIPDSFFADLVNGWMIVYLEAKKQKRISQGVLLEWMNGMTLLLEAFFDEYVFDSTRSRERFKLIANLAKKEKEELLKALELEPNYRAPPNYWSLFNKPSFNSVFSNWSPFGVETASEEFQRRKLEKWELPEMASFAYQIIENYKGQKLKGKYVNQNFTRNPANAILACSSLSKDKGSYDKKAIIGFGLRLLMVPYYDALREGLASLYVLADRHLEGGSWFHWGDDRKSEESPLEILPSIQTSSYKQRFSLGTFFPIYSKHPDCTTFKPNYYPESHLPRTQADYQSDQDLNSRIQKIYSSEERRLPFFTVEEEKEFLSFVQKDPRTRLPEYLTFASKTLHKFNHPHYQAALEHIFFSVKGGDYLEELFNHSKAPFARAQLELLFNFFDTGIQRLLKKKAKNQNGAAFLFHTYFRLIQMASHYSFDQTTERADRLFEVGEQLLKQGKENSALGKLLGEAVFAALPTIESVPLLRQHPKCLPFLTKTILLECRQQRSVTSKYEEMILNYAYHSFKALLKQVNDLDSLWLEAVREVFPEYTITSCCFDSEKGEIKFDAFTCDLCSRSIQSSDDFKMQLLPKEIVKNHEYEKLFDKKRILASQIRSGEMHVYTFKYKGMAYEIHWDSIKGKQEIFKRQEGKLYKFAHNPFTLSDWHYFIDTHFFWQNAEIFLVENKESKKIEALADEQGIHKIKKGIPSSLVLAEMANVQDPLKKLVEGFARNHEILFWMDRNSNALQLVEFPLFELQFIAREQAGKSTLFCKNYPGFFIASSQYMAFLKNCSLGYMILENEKGQKKVLIPLNFSEQQIYMPYEEKSIHLVSSRRQNSDLVVLDLDSVDAYPKFVPGPSQTTAILMLIYIYFSTKQYQQALTLIQETNLTAKRRLDKTSAEILDHLINFSDSQKMVDVHPHAVALRLRLFAWAIGLENKQFSLKKDQELRKKLNVCIENYEDLSHHHGIFALDSEVLRELESIYYGQTSKMLRIESNFYISYLFSGRQEQGVLKDLRKSIVEQSLKAPLSIRSFVALGEEFILNFLYFYQIAKLPKPSSEKQQLARLIALSYQYEQPIEVRVLCCLLTYAFVSPEALSFQEVQKIFVEEDNVKFENQLSNLYEQAQKVLKDHFTYSEENSLQKWLINRSQRPFKVVFSSEHKVAIHPSPIDSPVSFEAMPRINVPQLEDMTSLASIEGHILAEVKINLDQDLQSTSVIETWAKQKAVQFPNEDVFRVHFERLKNGAAAYQKDLKQQPLIGQGLSRDKSLIELACQNYDKELTNQKLLLDQEEQNLLNLVHETYGNEKVALEFLRGERIYFDVGILLVALGRGDLSAIKNGNPALNEEQIWYLMEKVAHYALARSHFQHLNRCYQNLKEYQVALETQNEAVLQEVSQEYCQVRAEKRAYEPSERPDLLVFEVLGDLFLREEQCKALSSLTSLDEIFKLFEARTGFGKTKALLPLWLLIVSGRLDCLAIMATSATLFDPQVNYLQRFLHRAYRFFGVRIDFSRDSNCSQEEIEKIKADLKQAQALRRPVFMSDQTIHNLLILKIKEIASQSIREEQEGILFSLLGLRRYIKKTATLFIDEPHKVLDDQQEHNYSLGSPTRFEPKRLLFNLKLYVRLCSILQGRYRLEFWQANSKLPLLTKELFQTEILSELLEAMLKAGDLSADNESLRYLKNKMSPEEQQIFEKKLEDLFSKSKDPNLLYIRILHDQLYHYLAQTLGRNANEHYALLDPAHDRLAIPMEDARNPKKGNEFCMPDQVINFTIQANLATPFSISYVSNFLEQLALDAAIEMEAGVKHLARTKAYQKYDLIIQEMKNPPKSLLNMTPAECESVYQYVDTHFAAKLQLIGIAVLPFLSHYNEKISSNPHLLGHCFKKVVGASGTLSLQNLPYRFVVEHDEKAIARTLISVAKQHQADPHIIELSKEDSQNVLQALPKVIQNASVFIEVGAILRNHSSLLKVAYILLEQLHHFDAVATFDEQGAPIVLKRGGKRFIPKKLVKVAADKIFWLYAQKDITGTDEKLLPLAKAIIFVNEYTTETEFVQGIGRMRGVHKSQTVRFCVDYDSANLIRKKLKKSADENLTYLDIFEYCALVESFNRSLAGLPSLELQWNALLENHCFWDNILSCKDQDEIIRMIRLLRFLLVESTKDEPVKRASLSSNLIPFSQALTLLEKHHTEKMNKVQKVSTVSYFRIDEAQIKVNRKQIQDKMLYPKEVRMNDDANLTQTVESLASQQSEMQTAATTILDLSGEKTTDKEVEKETETTEESTQCWSIWNEKMRQRKPLPRTKEIKPHSIQQLFGHEKLQEFIPLCSHLHISENGACTLVGDTIKTPGWINGYVKPLHYLFLNDQEQWVLIDESEAAFSLKTQQGKTLWLVNHGVLFSKKGTTTKNLQEDENFQFLELEAKFINGDFNFTELQWSFFKKWVNENKTRYPLLMKFIDSILSNLHPSLKSSVVYQRLVHYGTKHDLLENPSLEKLIT